jgi:hypothetical protein
LAGLGVNVADAETVAQLGIRLGEARLELGRGGEGFVEEALVRLEFGEVFAQGGVVGPLGCHFLPERDGFVRAAGAAEEASQ